MSDLTSTIGKVALAALCAIALSGCSTVGAPVGGVWMQNVGAPVGVGSTTGGTKEGRACATSWFGVFAMGDASIKAAAANGGITKIDSVDGEYNAMIIKGDYCTIVRGS